MKKSRIVLIISVLCIVILCVLLFVHPGLFYRIDIDQVDEIYALGYQLDAGESEEFIKLFNSAKYRKDVGYDITSYYGFTVYFHDGTRLEVEDCESDNFYVYRVEDGLPLKRTSFFIESKELYAFLSEFAER